MMTPAEFNAATLDLPISPSSVKRSQAQVIDVLFSTKHLSVGVTAQGLQVAMWPHSSVYVADGLEELRGVLNSQERSLLPV